MTKVDTREVVVRGITKIDFAATAFCVLSSNAFWEPTRAQQVMLLGGAATILLVLFCWRRWRPLLIARLQDGVVQIREVSRIPPRLVSLRVADIETIELLGPVGARRVHFHLRSGGTREVKLGIGMTRVNQRVTDLFRGQTELPVELGLSFEA